VKVFKEIIIGGIKKELLLQRLSDAGVQFNAYAETLFNHPSFSPSDRLEKVKLVKIGLSNLDLKVPCSYQQIIDKAAKARLNLAMLRGMECLSS
jgi:hypothetical protein